VPTRERREWTKVGAVGARPYDSTDRFVEGGREEVRLLHAPDNKEKKKRGGKKRQKGTPRLAGEHLFVSLPGGEKRRGERGASLYRYEDSGLARREKRRGEKGKGEKKLGERQAWDSQVFPRKKKKRERPSYRILCLAATGEGERGEVVGTISWAGCPYKFGKEEKKKRETM